MQRLNPVAKRKIQKFLEKYHKRLQEICLD